MDICDYLKLSLSLSLSLSFSLSLSLFLNLTYELFLPQRNVNKRQFQ
jgi:hypothetical protein